MQRSSIVAALVGALLGGTACGDGTGPAGMLIRAELHRLPDGSSGGMVSFDRSSTMPQAHSWSSDLVVTSFETPVRAIWLEGPNDAFMMIYECEADSNDGCLVDLAGAALQDLLGATPFNAQPGTYDQVTVSTCESEGAYTAYVTGSLALGGSDYSTHSVSVLSNVHAAEPLSLVFSGCARTYPVPAPLVVSDSAGATIAFKLYFDMRDLVWASLGGPETAGGWIPGGCAGPRPEAGSSTSPYLCAGYPDVAGVVSDAAPTIERYRINGGATLGLIFQETGEFIGGFSRRYFTPGSDAEPGFSADTPVETWSDNGDGTYHLATYGTSSGGGGPQGHMLEIAAFTRGDHAGVAVAHGGSVFQYSALRIN